MLARAETLSYLQSVFKLEAYPEQDANFAISLTWSMNNAGPSMPTTMPCQTKAICHWSGWFNHAFDLQIGTGIKWVSNELLNTCYSTLAKAQSPIVTVSIGHGAEELAMWLQKTDAEDAGTWYGHVRISVRQQQLHMNASHQATVLDK